MPTREMWEFMSKSSIMQDWLGSDPILKEYGFDAMDIMGEIRDLLNEPEEKIVVDPNNKDHSKYIV